MTQHGPEAGDDQTRRPVPLDEVIATAGLGRFHIRLVLACGLGFAAAAVEVVLTGFLISELREDFKANEYVLSLLPTLVSIGSITGEFFWGYMADQCGRRIVFLVTVLIVVLFGVLSAFSNGMVMLIILRFFVGFGYGGNIAVDFTLFAEFLPTRLRGEMLFAVSAFWPLGQTVTSGIAWLTIPKYGWRTFLIACAVPSFLTSFLRPFIPESPRWLLLHGREEEAWEVCRQIVELNGLTVEEANLDNARLVLSNEAQKLQKSHVPPQGAISKLLSKGMWRTTVGCLTFNCMLNFSGYATTTFMPSFLELKGLQGMDMYASMLISSLAQIPGILLAVAAGSRAGRLRPIYTSLMLQAIALIIFAFARNGALLIFCSCLASCFLEFGWALCHVYVPEAFPTEIRACAQGAVSGFGSVASLITPLLTAWLLHTSSPAVAVAVFSIVLALASFALTTLLHVETLDRDLADTALD